jgi:hypothetical protein
MFRWLAVIALACELLGVGAMVTARDTTVVPGQPAAIGLHYAANDNFDVDGHYQPARYGFNLADVSTPAQLAALPSGVLGLAYLGSCAGADSAFTALVDSFSNNPKLFGFYLLDEPDPATCPPAALKSESTYIHNHITGARTFILEQNLSASTNPSYLGGYNAANTGIDFFGIDPYPCRTELHGCDPTMIASYVAAAERFGIPKSSIIPVYQAFGGGTWIDDGDGSYQLPTAAQMKSILAQWAKLIPNPVFDFVYSWGSQRADAGLAGAPPDVLAVLAAHNAE